MELSLHSVMQEIPVLLLIRDRLSLERYNIFI